MNCPDIYRMLLHDRRLHLLAIVLVTIALRLPGLDPDLTDHDSWRQTDTASIARNFLDEPRILWPRIDWGAPGPGYVEAEFQLYTFATSLLYRVLGENPIFGRLLTLLVTALACIVMDRIARRFFEGRLALLCVGIFAMAPMVFRYSYVFMPDATSLLFFLVALQQFLRFLDDNRWRSVILSALAMCLAILVKPTAIHLGLVLCILAISRRGWRCLFEPKLIGFALVALIPPTAYYIHAIAIHLTYGNTFGVLSGGDSKWGTLAWRLNPRFYFNLAFVDSAWTVGPIGTVLAIVGLVRFRADYWRLLVIPWSLVTLLYYFIVARYAGQPEMGLQYHIFVVPLVALLTTGGFAVALGRWRKNIWVVPLLFALVVGYQGVINTLILAKPNRELLIEAGRAVASVSRPDDLILVLSEDAATAQGGPNNFEQPDVFFHARRRGRVLPRDGQSAEGLKMALVPEIRWFVNFPHLNERAEPSYHGFIHSRMNLVLTGQGYEIYSIPSGMKSDEGTD